MGANVETYHTDSAVGDNIAVDFFPDHEYKAAFKETLRIREQMSMEWSKQRNEGKVRRLEKPGRSTRKCPETCDCFQLNLGPPKRGTPAGGPRSKMRVSQSRTGRGEGVTGSLDDSSSEASLVDVEKTKTTRGSPDTATEISAKTCDRCLKIKKAPGGKKIAWRERTKKWMYVHKDAPDEGGPAESEDDNEPLPEARTEPAKAPGETNGGVDAIETHEHRQQPEDDGLSVDEGYGDGTAVVQKNEKRESSMMTPSSMDDTNPTSQETSTQEAEPSTTYENADAGQQIGSERGDGVVNSSNQRNTMVFEPAPGTEAPLAEAAKTPVPVPQSATVAIEAAAGVDVESKKRQNKSEHETPVPKKARIDIDLTIDDDDELVAVKSEHVDDAEQQEDEYKLEQLERETRILKLEMEKAELRRKIAKRRGQDRTAIRVKQEPVIKIED